MHIKGGFEKAKVYIESHSELGQDKIPQGPCITISRETGAGSDLVSEHLIEFFKENIQNKNVNWSIFDRNLIEKVMEDHNLPGALSDYFSEDKKSKITSMIDELFGVHPPLWTILQKTSSTILNLAQVGYVVIVGRGGNIITSKLKNCIHVRLVGNLEDRILHIENHYSVGRKEAIEFIKKEDANRKNYIFTNFKKQIDDPAFYHLVINTSLITHSEAAYLICNLTKRRFPELFGNNQ
jgi:hypothetical protein